MANQFKSTLEYLLLIRTAPLHCTGGGSLTTYKELCALATDLGQPDLVYRFMELANHQAGVQSSRGAAFG